MLWICSLFTVHRESKMCSWNYTVEHITSQHTQYRTVQYSSQIHSVKCIHLFYDRRGYDTQNRRDENRTGGTMPYTIHHACKDRSRRGKERNDIRLSQTRTIRIALTHPQLTFTLFTVHAQKYIRHTTYTLHIHTPLQFSSTSVSHVHTTLYTLHTHY